MPISRRMTGLTGLVTFMEPIPDLTNFWSASFLMEQCIYWDRKGKLCLWDYSKAEAKGIVAPDLADRLRGEAYFLRGMTYYYLAGTFGGVPLELDTSGNVTSGLTPRITRIPSLCRLSLTCNMRNNY